MTTSLLGGGVYSFPEAARLTGLKQHRVREWFRGRPSGPGRKRVLSADYEPIDGEFAISFHDLIDLFVAGQLREHGVSLQLVRRVYAQMSSDLGTRHPFCRKELLTNGKAVFMKGLDAEGEEELVEVLTKQKVFPAVLEPFLQRIDYDKATILAKRWRISGEIVIDPAICLGKPTVGSTGVPSSVLAAAYYANSRDADLVGDWYDVRPADVLAAVEFERRLAA